MRAVIQRVKSASVSVDGQIVSSIGKGLLCLIGVARDDTAKDTESIAKSILKLRLFPETASDESPQWKQSVVDIKGDLLCVSQFTLLALTSKGAKPDFHDAMAPNEAKTLYEQLLFRLGQSYDGKIADGRFGAMMDVSLVNWGPVTIQLDSKDDGSPARSAFEEAKAAKRLETEQRRARNEADKRERLKAYETRQQTESCG